MRLLHAVTHVENGCCNSALVTREKLHKALLYKKLKCKMLIKYPFAKKLQSQNVTREKLRKALS